MNIQQLMQQAQRMQEQMQKQMQKTQEELDECMRLGGRCAGGVLCELVSLPSYSGSFSSIA